MSDEKQPARFILFSEIVEANGKTIRENNMAIGHKYRPGQEVRVKRIEAGEIVEDGDYIAFVLSCDRDCDGTPLYSVGAQACWREIDWHGTAVTTENLLWRIMNRVESGCSEDMLSPSDFKAEVRKMFEEKP